jgi:hypothetical protein
MGKIVIQFWERCTIFWWDGYEVRVVPVKQRRGKWVFRENKFQLIVVDSGNRGFLKTSAMA